MEKNNQRQKINIITVKPYFYVYTTFVKQRWLKNKYIDILTIEFRDFDREYFLNALTVGQVQVLRKNKFVHAPDLVVVDLDVIFHFIHRHESPCFQYPYVVRTNIEYNIQEKRGNQGQLCTYKQDVSLPASTVVGYVLENAKNVYNPLDGSLHWVNIKASGNNLFLAHKPAGLPVHPTSHYNALSLINLLGNGFSPINRLDKLVSGYLLGGLSEQKQIQQALVEQLQYGDIMKLYVARTVKTVSESRQILIYAPIKQRFIGKKGKINNENEANNYSPYQEIDPDTVMHIVDGNLVKAVYSEEILKQIQQLQTQNVSNESIFDLKTSLGVLDITGIPSSELQATLKQLINKDSSSNQNKNGIISAITLIQTIQNTNLVLLYPVTGRTHQLRLHLQYISMPIIDDPLYGGNRQEIEKLYLDLLDMQCYQTNDPKLQHKKQETNNSEPKTEQQSFTKTQISNLAKDAFSRLKIYKSKMALIETALQTLDVQQCDKFRCVWCQQMNNDDLYNQTLIVTQSKLDTKNSEEDFKYTFVTKENIIKSKNPYRYIQTRISLANIFYKFFYQIPYEQAEFTNPDIQIINQDIQLTKNESAEFYGQLPEWLDKAEQDQINQNMQQFKQLLGK